MVPPAPAKKLEGGGKLYTQSNNLSSEQRHSLMQPAALWVDLNKVSQKERDGYIPHTGDIRNHGKGITNGQGQQSLRTGLRN